MFLKKYRFLIALLFVLTVTVTAAGAQEAQYRDTGFETVGINSPRALSDSNRNTYTTTAEGASISVSRPDGIASLYIEFDRIPSQWTLTDPATGNSVQCGQNSFLHEFVDVASLFGSMPQQVIMTLPAGLVIADIYAFSEGELPDFVQIWDPPCQQADLLLISSHSDDEQLFFAGVLPYYTMERGLSVQVTYIVQHFEAYGYQNHQRPHEQLDGLWTVGVRNYPVMSDFPDVYSESKDRQTAFNHAAAAFGNVGVTYDDFISYITECLRRFKPLVVVSHDLNGEYGHGTHVFCSAALTEAIGYAADESKYPESAQTYGTWTPEKTYLHLYSENQIVMDWDTPLDSLGGKTPFQVTQEGFACHKSQHWTWFYKWIYGTFDSPITKATQIRGYSPCRYGLYDTKVGPDVVGGDFFENVETYAQRIARAEAEAKAAEEAARLQAEAEAAAQAQAEAEAAAKALAEAAAQAKAEEEARAKAEAEAAAQAEAARQAHVRQVAWSVGIAVVILCAAVILTLLLRRRKTPAKR